MSGRIDGGARHDWLGYLRPLGLPVAPAALSRIGLWPAPQTAADGHAAAAAVATLLDGAAWPFFADVLGWPAERVAGAPGGPPLPDLSVTAGEDTVLAPDWAVLAADGPVQLLVRIEPADLVLDRRAALDGWEATAQQRFERLLRETGVGVGILLGAQETGRKDSAATEPVLRLVTAHKGEASGHLTWPLAALGDTAGRGMLAGLKLLLDAHALFTGPPSHRLPALLAESRTAQADVSTRLAGQVLASLHELLRGLDAADPAAVRALAAHDPQHLYKGLLTVLLRLVFILYAEDRDLMPSGRGADAAALYEQGYALGGLHLRLRDDAALHADVMDERRGAWGRLLALFRLVERGAPSGFMQARGGTMFDSAAFPFLLGQRTRADAERVLPVGDGCILRVLDGLLMLDGERVAYRALSVEQIGSVYETVMGFTVEAARAPMLAIRAGKGHRVPVWVDLADLAGAPAAEREKLLKRRTGRGTYPAPVARALREAADVAALAAALAPVADARACPRGAPVAAGTPILQPTDERRRTGSHYTPPALTRPIVEHALAPAFTRIGADALPAAVLDLKVCDPAAGSGAFLVEACRQLGERLVAAWTRWPQARPTIPADEDDLLHAKRLVAQHCLRGVDRNPLAIDLARLSLWLETLASQHEFTFLDNVLRCGDSLVGLPNPKIVALTWGKAARQHGFVEAIVREGIEAAADLRRLMRSEAEIAPYAVQEQRHRAAVGALERAHLVADAILHSFFDAATPRDREARLTEVERLVLAPDAHARAALGALRDRLRAAPIGIESFHWELEFDDLFARPNPGFDAIVGNPPFAGRDTIIGGNAAAYPGWLKTLHPESHGNADLAAHFFRRAFALLRAGGAFGLIATNTIRQGDTRESGLQRILEDGGVIVRATSRHRWEGDAAVVVAQVFVRKGAGGDTPMLDGRQVERISAYLVEGALDGSPTRLGANAGLSFKGYDLLGQGFLFDDEASAKGNASSLQHLRRLRADHPDEARFVFPLIGGDELMSCLKPGERRFAIWLNDMTLEQATRHAPHLLDIVERRVKPERLRQKDPGAKKFWWRYLRDRPEMRAALAQADAYLCCPSVSPHLCMVRLPTSLLPSKQLAVFALPSFASFAVLQSRVHETWARFFASSMKDDLRYTPTDCFETFPLPPGHAEASALEAAGAAYHDARAALMVARGEGMTPTYNRFHRAADTSGDIAGLRARHHDLDRAVLAAYGWDDLAALAAPAFLDEATETDHRYQGRLFWPAPFRDELLARLLRLNEDRALMERML